MLVHCLLLTNSFTEAYALITSGVFCEQSQYHTVLILFYHYLCSHLKRGGDEQAEVIASHLQSFLNVLSALIAQDPMNAIISDFVSLLCDVYHSYNNCIAVLDFVRDSIGTVISSAAADSDRQNKLSYINIYKIYVLMKMHDHVDLSACNF